MRLLITIAALALSACGTFHKPTFDGGTAAGPEAGLRTDASALDAGAGIDASLNAVDANGPPPRCEPYDSRNSISPNVCEEFLDHRPDGSVCILYSGFLCADYTEQDAGARVPCCSFDPTGTPQMLAGECGATSFTRFGGCLEQGCTIDDGLALARCDPLIRDGGPG